MLAAGPRHCLDHFVPHETLMEHPDNQYVAQPDKLQDLRFLRLTGGLGMPVLAERDASSDIMET